MLFYLFMSPNLLRLSVIQKICENWSTTAGKAKRRFDPQTFFTTVFVGSVKDCSAQKVCIVNLNPQ